MAKVAILRRDGAVVPKRAAVRTKMVLLEENEAHAWQQTGEVE